MARGPVNIIEMHIEKGVLGLAGACLLVVAVLYLIRTPNTIEYGGQKVGPGELSDLIRRDAEAMRMAIDKSRVEAPEVPDFSALLEQQQTAGILGNVAEEVALKPALPLVAEFGHAIPALRDEEEPAGQVSIVTPLRPTTPVMRTGRNLVVARPPSIPGLTAGSERERTEEAVEPIELAWVSGAAYFSIKAQKDAMSAANYAPSRSRVYLVGTDVERQEVLASGEFSEWQPMNSKAMPAVEIPDVQADPATGVAESDQQKYELVKASQEKLAQPEFYEVVSGDPWEMPALDGYGPALEEPAESEADIAALRASRRDRDEQRRRARAAAAAAARPAAPSIGRGTPAGGKGMGRGGGEGIGGGGRGTLGPSNPGAAAAGREKAEARKEIKADLKAAQVALGKKDYAKAQELANKVANHMHASADDVRKADSILDSVEEATRSQRTATGGPSSGPPVRRGAAGGDEGFTVGDEGGGGRGVVGGGRTVGPGPGVGSVVSKGPSGMPQVAPSGAGPAERSETLVTHPDDPEMLAVYFHDDTVEAGKTYRYRMRIKLWNRYAGQFRAVQNSELAKRTVLEGEWSLPSATVTVTPRTHFFVASAALDRESARVETWAWHKGKWLKEAFNVGIGDVVGGTKRVKTGETDEDGKEVRDDVDFLTGAVVLDLRFNEPVAVRNAAGKTGEFTLRETPSLVLVYLDPADGQVKERAQALDKYDPIYTDLKSREEP